MPKSIQAIKSIIIIIVGMLDMNYSIYITEHEYHTDIFQTVRIITPQRIMIFMAKFVYS